MATNPKLRAALLKHLDVTRQALSLRVQRKKDALPMSTEDAVYVIAHEEGLRIDRYLDASNVERVRSLIAQMSAPAPIPRSTGRAVKGARDVRVYGEFRGTDPLLPAEKLAQAKEMAAIFPLLYVIENSMRELVRRVMRAKYGTTWWTARMIAGKLKGIAQTVATRMTTEKRNTWHQRRGADELDYIDLDNLGDIIRAHESDFFGDIIPDKEWFIQFMRELYPSRCVVCHMNPLDETNVRDLRIKSDRWQRLVRESLGKIPR